MRQAFLAIGFVAQKRPLRTSLTLLLLAVAAPAAAAPFAVTFLTPEAILVVDLGSIRRSGKTVTYRTYMMVQPSPDLADSKLGHLEETREARCATGEVRRLAMSAAIAGEEEMRMPIPDDPWTRLEASERQAVCEPGRSPEQVLPTLDAARATLTSAAPPP